MKREWFPEESFSQPEMGQERKVKVTIDLTRIFRERPKEISPERWRLQWWQHNSKKGQANAKESKRQGANRCLGISRNAPKQEVAEHTSPSVGGIERTGPRKNVHKWAANSLKSPTVNAGQGNSQECKLG